MAQWAGWLIRAERLDIGTAQGPTVVPVPRLHDRSKPVIGATVSLPLASYGAVSVNGTAYFVRRMVPAAKHTACSSVQSCWLAVIIPEEPWDGPQPDPHPASPKQPRLGPHLSSEIDREPCLNGPTAFLGAPDGSDRHGPSRHGVKPDHAPTCPSCVEAGLRAFPIPTSRRTHITPRPPSLCS